MSRPTLQRARVTAWPDERWAWFLLICDFLVDFSTWLPLHFTELTSKLMSLIAGPSATMPALTPASLDPRGSSGRLDTMRSDGWI